ncbi:ATPase [Candidatus Peregrinibacteria bacterium CG_4_10_14_0_2_um_filter_38_24]|nr:MAG: ATPase [Candidatus Peregrinibacteria bacterium CG_4_10_14_0_2_um_filter_38_24]
MGLTEAQVQKLIGLTAEDVAQNLKKHGFNELPSSKKRSVFAIILEIMKEPMLSLLLVCGGIYLILGDMEEAIFLSFSILVVIGITIYQENKMEKALTALKDLSSPRALVIRDGERMRIAGREVVSGDIIILNEGDRVPADAVILWERNLSADESLLTGESVPVTKLPTDSEDVESVRPGGQDNSFVFSGSLIVAGQGVARVFATGINTEMGKIGKALQSIEPEKTVLQKETSRLVRLFFIIAVVIFVVIIAAFILWRGEILNGFLYGITVAISLLPEEFAVVLTVFLALGAWRISKKHVLTRKIGAVEILGAATVLCVDKTGTLTQNVMSIQEIFVKGKTHDVLKNKKKSLPEYFHEIIEYAILASKKDPFDPMEKAFLEIGEITLKDTEHLHAEWSLLKEYPLSRDLLALSHVYKSDKNGRFHVVAAKGAPEAIFDLCHLFKEKQKALGKNIEAMAAKGLRVLGVAKAIYRGDDLPTSQHEFDFEFLGLVGLADPIRETVPHAIAECYKAGIRVIMITGDYPITARNIGEQIGLMDHGNIITGAELEKISINELAQKIKNVNVFARVVPEQKLIIVQALKKDGEIVAMTGDGVNDAPALKAAHIGVAMGERGTDVARESSALVLLKDDFNSIVAAVKVGRRIFDNIKKAMAYIVSVHVPIAGLALFPVLFNWPIVFYPVHVVFLELIIDPVCSVVFEAEKGELNIMSRAPRNPADPLFSKKLLVRSFLQGAVSFLIISVVFNGTLYYGVSDAYARTVAFIVLVSSNIGLVFVNRFYEASVWKSLTAKNPALLYVIFGAFSLLILSVYVPFMRDIFKFEEISILYFLLVTIIGFTGGMSWKIVEFFKLKK